VCRSNSILYYQRDAPSAYQVTSNMVTQYVPGATAMASLAEVTGWLSNIVSSVWTDPVCGDGKCELPFEFPTYGRFGCKADCGMFTNSFNVTGVQVDFFYDFTHPAGSTPATTLLQQASWNVCPQEDSNVNGPASDPPLAPVPHGQACYYDADIAFKALVGHDTAVLPDVPDGLWQVQINSDIFNKVSGTARNLQVLTGAAIGIKQDLAAYTVWRANYYEYSTLRSARPFRLPGPAWFAARMRALLHNHAHSLLRCVLPCTPPAKAHSRAHTTARALTHARRVCLPRFPSAQRCTTRT
jgi:hypothetical protein